MGLRVVWVGVVALVALGACSDNTRYAGEEDEPCGEDVACEDDESLSDVPCDEGERSCRATTSCGEAVFCRGPQDPEPPGGVPEPDPGECDGVPFCIDDEIGGEACFVGEIDCRMESLCGEVTFCRAAEGCLAFPTCAQDQTESRHACLPDEEGCGVANICGVTLFCRDREDCRAAPSCEDDEIASDEPCTVVESGCRVEVVCGSAIACRPAR